MRKISTVVAALAAATVLAGPASAEIRNHTFKVSNGASKDHPVAAGVDGMSACLERESDGKMSLRGFYSGQLGDDLEATQSVRSGSIEMVVTGSDAIGGIEPAMNVFGLPFLFGSEAEVDAVLTGPFYDYVAAKMPQHGLVLLSFWENGFRNATNSKRPITRIEDFEGLNFRVMQNNIFLETFRRLGANPVPMAFGEVFTALETGAVDGQENPLPLIQASKFHEVQKYLTLTRHAYSPTPVLFSSQIWDRLTAEEQALLGQCAAEGREAQLKRSREVTTGALTDLEAAGMQANELSDAEMDRLRQVVLPVYESSAGAVGQETMDLMMATLKSVRGE